MNCPSIAHMRNSVPPKESPPAFQIVRGRLPQSFHSPAIYEPDPIYPYLPFLFGVLLGNERAKFSEAKRPWSRHLKILKETHSTVAEPEIYSCKLGRTLRTSSVHRTLGGER